MIVVARHVTIRHPERGEDHRAFESARHAWEAFEHATRELGSEGFIPEELETVRYGSAWAQEFVREEHIARISIVADPMEA